MSRYYEKEQNIPQPEYDAMWVNIEQEATKRKAALQQSQEASMHRAKIVPASIVFSCFLLVAIPVFAGVAINWDRIGGRSVTIALNNGIGQRYDLKASSAGITMNLNGVVTDGEKMKMLISLDPGTDPTSYIGFAIENTMVTSNSDTKERARGYLNYDPQSQKLLGIYETVDTLKDRKKDYTLEAQNLIFYRNQDIPLKTDHQAGDTLVTGSKQYPNIYIESVRQTNNKTVVRFRVAAAPSDLGRGNPHLVMKVGDKEIDAIPTILPSDSPDLHIEQVFNMTAQDWKKANLHFCYIEEAKRIEGTWKFEFEADGKKASEAIYSKKLHTSAEFQENTGTTLDQLIVTPLDIEILVTERDSLKKGNVHYKTAQLVIGDKKISGGWNMKGAGPENYQHLYQFESPEWYKDWSDVPMKLILKDAVIEKRDTSKNWITLHKPKEEKQFAELNTDGYQIDFTYYTEGKDLIVESKSGSPGFKGVNQTTMRINGKEVVPEIIAKGMVSTGVNVDRYKDIELDGKLELNPGIYKYSDPRRDIEVILK
ncbi:RNA polymerase subunit sigma [Paenibacillus terrae]|uniref:RNA polymerase subunit sigma n=1 Tax=Paenibacillus terrae TaxID=159743 RepID=A0A4U2Q5K6_9BACL|nr:DUF4179 domain-containing protein [Paenibacillus terrae]TKH45084.1 RNA polymerase subunit sigma [Paenibacillus terrae]